MIITSESFNEGQAIDAEFALCQPDPEKHAGFAGNRNPQLGWSQAPAETKSFILICVDPDAPSKPDDVNQEGRTVPASLPRADFYHWVLVDIPASASSVDAGSDSDDVTPRGKDQMPGPHGARRGLNDYTSWFADDADMDGKYFGYDGPCPPWNDELPHRYIFTIYALDIDHCNVSGAFSASDVLSAIEGHVLDQASISCTYQVNPDL